MQRGSLDHRAVLVSPVTVFKALRTVWPASLSAVSVFVYRVFACFDGVAVPEMVVIEVFVRPAEP